MKYNILLEKRELIDPYNEEDWDEIDENKYYMFKIRIGAQTKTINIILFSPFIDEKVDDGRDIITIHDDRLRKLKKYRKNDFENRISEGISLSNCFMVLGDHIIYDNVIDFIFTYLKGRLDKCNRIIHMYNEYDGEDYEDSDYNEEQVNDIYPGEKLLKDNIEIILHQVDNIIKQKLTDNELKYI